MVEVAVGVIDVGEIGLDGVEVELAGDAVGAFDGARGGTDGGGGVVGGDHETPAVEVELAGLAAVVDGVAHGIDAAVAVLDEHVGEVDEEALDHELIRVAVVGIGLGGGRVDLGGELVGEDLGERDGLIFHAPLDKAAAELDAGGDLVGEVGGEDGEVGVHELGHGGVGVAEVDDVHDPLTKLGQLDGRGGNAPRGVEDILERLVRLQAPFLPHGLDGAVRERHGEVQVDLAAGGGERRSVVDIAQVRGGGVADNGVEAILIPGVVDRLPAIDAEEAGILLVTGVIDAEERAQAAAERLSGGGVIPVEPFEVVVVVRLVVGGLVVEVHLGVFVEREAAAGVHAVA